MMSAFRFFLQAARRSSATKHIVGAPFRSPKFRAHPVDAAPIVYITNSVFHDFRWIRWNIDKVERHGCTPLEAQQVVNNPSRGFPRRSGKKYQVHGRGEGGRWVQVAYLIDPDGTIFVIHAMPLSSRRRRGGR